jgi:hypothetical protein
MSFLEQIGNAIKPHAMAIGEVANYHGTKITNVLTHIDRGISDLGRPGYDDEWGSSVIQLPSVTGDLTPELRCRANQIILIQSITITAIPTGVGEAITLVTDSSVVKFTTGRTISTGIGTYSPLDDTVIVGGSIPILPGEHVTVAGVLMGTTGQIVVNYVLRNINAHPRSADTGKSGEEYTGKNTHEAARDEIMVTAGYEYVEPPGPIRASNGLISERTTNLDGTLDPTSI